MRLGIHPIQQREIIKFVQDRLRPQFWGMIALGLAVAALAAAFIFRPPAPPPKLAVALVQTSSASASGFLVGAQLVLTAARAVGNQGQVTVLFPDKPLASGQVVFSDLEGDVALVKVADIDPSLKPLPLGTSDGLANNEELTVVGYPADMYTESGTTLTRRDGDTLITDLATNPGNTGAPLIRKADGTVVGMVHSTPEFGGAPDNGRHRAVAINVVDRICRERQNPIR